MRYGLTLTGHSFLPVFSLLGPSQDRQTTVINALWPHPNGSFLPASFQLATPLTGQTDNRHQCVMASP